MKLRLLVLTVFLVGCAQLSSLGDWANENPAVADIVIRQSVARYIGGGDTADDEAVRAESVTRVAALAESFLDGNPKATVDELLRVVDASIDWGSMSVPDRLLVEDLLTLTQMQLLAKQTDGALDPDELLGVRSLLKTARSAAQRYSG